jgi:sugar phosphate permease
MARRRLSLSYRWASFGSLALGLSLVLFHQSAAATISSHLAREWTLDAASLGLLGSLWFLPYAIMQIPGGYIADFWGPRKVVTGSLAVMSVGALLFASANTYGMALGARLLIGAGSSLILVPSLKSFAVWFRAREFATVQGLFILTGNLIGALAATTPLAFVSDRLGWRTPLISVALLGFVATALNWWVIREGPRDLGLPEVTRYQSGMSSRARDATREARSDSRRFRDAIYFIADQPILRISWVILFISFGSFFGLQGLWAGPWLRDVRGLTSVEIGVWLMLLPMGLGIGTLGFGYVSDRILGRRRPLIIVGLVLQALLWVLLILFMADVPESLGLLLFFLLGFAMGGTLLIQVVIKEVCPYHLFGSILGFMNTAAFFGSATVQIVTGWILGLVTPVSFAPEPVYSASAYLLALAPVSVAALAAVGLCWLLPETLPD